MTFDNLLLARDGAVAILTINRPKVNALNGATLAELRTAFEALRPTTPSARLSSPAVAIRRSWPAPTSTSWRY